MKIKEKALALLKDCLNIKDEEKRINVLAGAATEHFIEEMTDEERKEAVKCIKQYLTVTEKIRFARRSELKEQILDSNDKEYQDLDARSLNYMLDKSFNDSYLLINSLEQ